MEQEEVLYKRLLLAHYVEDTHNIKLRYNLASYKDVYKLLEKREKEILHLQKAVCVILEDENKNKMEPFFKHNGNPNSSLNQFISSVLNVDLTKPINKKSYDSYVKMIEYLKKNKMWEF